MSESFTDVIQCLCNKPTGGIGEATMGVLRHGSRRRAVIFSAVAALGGFGGAARGQALNGTVSIIPVSAGAGVSPYYATDLNSCAVDLNNLVTATVGGVTYQFMAYYDTSGNIWLGRRTPGA